MSTGRPHRHGADSLRTLGALGLLTAALPANLAVTSVALLRNRVRAARGTAPATAAPSGKTVLVSGGKMTKALQLCRSFHAAGHRVVLVESAKYRFTGHRFSSSVARFHTVPSPQDPRYPQALLDIVRAEGVDVYVPVCSPVASYYDAVAKRLLADHCEVVHADPATIEALDDKGRFAELSRELDLPVPESHRVTDPAQVASFDFAAAGRDFILKSIPYDPVHRLDLTLLPPTDAGRDRGLRREQGDVTDHPWVMQEFVAGQEYCTHGTARDGRLQVYCACESSAFQVNYDAVDVPEIEAWVTRFVESTGLTGQFSFDFIRGHDGRVHAIECNPRTHSAITLFDGHPDLARAYLEDGRPLIRPLPTARATYWLYHELWRMLSHPASARERARVVRSGRDAVFAWDDPLPFLLVHHLQIPWLLLHNLRHGKGWIRIDFNIGKLVEAAGD